MNEISGIGSSIGVYKNRRKIRIKNFRSLVMDGFIDIKPITLLFGKNGSGKSSFIKSIRFVGNNLFPALPGETNYRFDEHLDLGNFQEVVLNNNITNDIQIDYKEFFQESESFFNDESGKNETVIDKNINFSLSTVFGYHKKNKNLKSFKLLDSNSKIGLKIFPNRKNRLDNEFINSVFQPGSKKEAEDNYKAVFRNDGHGSSGYPNKSVLFGRTVLSPKGINNEKILNFIKYVDLLPFVDFNPKYIISYYNQLAQRLAFDKGENEFINYWINSLIKDIPSFTNRFFNSWYITPFREKPKSEYILSNNRFNARDYLGVLKSLDDDIEKYNPFYPGNAIDEGPLYFINDSIKKLGLGKKIELEKSGGKGRVLFTDNNENILNLSEASSGLLHILPIIISSYFSLYRYEDWVRYFGEPSFPNTILIEQPELHLHPALQAKLMEFLCGSVGGTYIIETHSEHMLRKIQVLIAKGNLTKEKIAIYYFDKDKKTGITSLEEMEIDEKGRFKTDWPPGFFDTDTELALDFFREISKN